MKNIILKNKDYFFTFGIVILIWLFIQIFYPSILARAHEVTYRQYDFVKKFSVQKCQCGVLFDPLKNFQTIPPQEWFLFPVLLKTQKSELEQEITLLLNSESSWGQTEHKATMKIQKKMVQC